MMNMPVNNKFQWENYVVCALRFEAFYYYHHSRCHKYYRDIISDPIIIDLQGRRHDPRSLVFHNRRFNSHFATL